MDLKKWFGIKRLFHYQKEVRAYFEIDNPTDPTLAVNNSDLCIYIPTGYGKTMAYAIPVYDYFSNKVWQPLRKNPKGCHVLIVLPSIELACQALEVLQTIFQDFADVKIEILDHDIQQKKPNILIAPAQLLTELAPPTCEICPIDFFPLRFVVVDEADRLLDLDNIGPWLFALQHITLKKDLNRGAFFRRVAPLRCECIDPDIVDDVEIPELDTTTVGDGFLKKDSKKDEIVESFLQGKAAVKFNKIILTATNVKNFRGYRMLRLYRPITINGLLDSKSESKLTQYIAKIGENGLSPDAVFTSVIKTGCRTLVFCRDAQRAISVGNKLAMAYPDVQCRSLSAATSASRRLKVLKAFKKGKIDVLVCSDLASRGLHLGGVKTVIHSDCPRNEEIYIHRIGRTARAGETGQSILMVPASQLQAIGGIVAAANKYRKCVLKSFSLKNYDTVGQL